MADETYIQWPFFTREHEDLRQGLWGWSADRLGHAHGADVEQACRGLVAQLGEAGFLMLCVPAAYGGANAGLDVRSLCLAREAFAYHAGLADFAFAMQGLGSGAISLFGAETAKQTYLPKVATGEMIAGFALSEKAAGSDVAAMTTTAERVDGGYVLSGEKTWISNGAIADVLTVFARTGEAPGAKGISAFVVPTTANGYEVVDRIEVIAPHPLATIRFNDVFVPDDHLIGRPGEGFKVAMSTLDVFRSTVGAAALGFARRAHDEALGRASGRKLFGEPLSELQMTQASLAEMALSIDASALLVFRAAWAKDRGQARVTREAAMAKLHATEGAQKVIDAALQLFGGQGVVSGEPVEQLYREIRALRIYEGASEVQKVVIARQALAAASA